MFFFLFGVASPHNRPNAQDHFAGAERLRHVIVSAKLQADNSIDLFRLRSQHHDWDLARRGIAFQDFADFQPGLFPLGAAPANKKTLALERENRLLALTSDRSSFSIWGRSPQRDVKPGSNRAGLRKMIDF